jgi:asparagine synthase (glutamine-hydrolysing)
LPELATQFDEPLGDASLVPTFLVSRLIRQHCTVALGGDGGDELFGGYSHYRGLLRPRTGLPRSVAALAQAGLERLPLGLKGRNYLLDRTRTARERAAHCGAFFDTPSRQKLLSPFLATGRRLPERAEAARAAAWRDDWSALRNATHLDFTTYLPDDILAKVDRASMRVSLEVRAPWLDHRIVEFAFGAVPDVLKTTSRQSKILPKRLARMLLPAELDLDRKQGFSPPMAAWLGGSWHAFAADVLDQADGALWHKPMLQRMLADLRRGYSHSARVFLLVMFELWRREYRVEVA